MNAVIVIGLLVGIPTAGVLVMGAIEKLDKWMEERE
mgnify:CR=1 FL=1